MNIQITKNAIDYLVDMCGLDQEEAEEHLLTAISMCKFPETNQSARVKELESALVEAVELIEQWHSMDTAGLLTKEMHKWTWKIYQDEAPEMQRINAALAKGK